MQEVDFVKVFIDPLNRCGFPYIVTGSVASIVYGEPRLTHDIDLVLELHSGQIQNFISLYPLDHFYCPPESVIKMEIAREARGHFNLIHHDTGYKADIYPVGQDKLHKWAMGKRRKVEIDHYYIWLAPVEYVIIRKLEYYQEGGSPKHLRDIRKMLEISTDDIDKNTLDQMLAEYNLSDAWNQSFGSD